jgi:hypothetical protein
MLMMNAMLAKLFKIFGQIFVATITFENFNSHVDFIFHHLFQYFEFCQSFTLVVHEIHLNLMRLVINECYEIV